MFGEYEESLAWFLQQLSTTNPDHFTKEDWALVRTYTRSDGCTRVMDWEVETCWEHDFYFRTHHDFEGKIISFCQANARYLQRMLRRSPFGVFNLRAYIRWAGVSLLGKPAWHGRAHYRSFQ